MRILVLTVVLSVLTFSGCVSSGTQQDRTGGDRNHITSEELREIDVENASAWDVVQRLRSNWLRSRSTAGFDGQRTFPRVVLDGLEYGAMGSLRNLNVVDVEEMHYLSASDATTRFGTGYPGGAILVTTR